MCRPSFAHAPNGFEFGDGINGAELGGLCDADDARFGIMNVGALEDATLDGLRIDFSVVTGQHQHLRAVGEEFGRAAFVAFDVRGLVAQDAVIRLAHSEGEGVGGGAIENEEDRHFVSKTSRMRSEAMAVHSSSP